MISILSWNVQGYQSAKPAKIANFILVQNADVVCLQEDVNIVVMKLPNYQIVSRCIVERVSVDFIRHLPEITYTSGANINLCNTIFVKQPLLPFVTGVSAMLFRNQSEQTVDRGAAIVKIKNITIANIHLCGGRHDDKKYNKLQQQKEKQVAELVKRYDPDIIVGDFNSENNAAEALETLRRYHFYQGLNTLDERMVFLQYYLGAHEWLRASKKYAAVCTADEVRPTSAYGGVPDWIYAKKHLFKHIATVEKVKAIPDFSDHNALLLNFKCL